MRGGKAAGKGGRGAPLLSLLPLFFPLFLLLFPAAAPLWCQERTGRGPERGTGEFADFFGRALRALPPQRVVVSKCDCRGKEDPSPSLKKSLDLLRRAWRSPGAAHEALDLLARGLEDLAKEKDALLREEKALRKGVLPPRFRILLGRIQCAAKIVQWELEERARREGRPRPADSPLTRYVAALLDLVYLSPEAGSLVVQLLSERGLPPGKRRCYLRKVHLPFLEEGVRAGKKGGGSGGGMRRDGGPSHSSRPWAAAVFRVLLERARANQALLEGKNPGPEKERKKEKKPPESGNAEKGVPPDWKELAERWKKAGKLPRSEAFRERERMINTLLAEGEDIGTALQGADLFYRTYPGFCSLGLGGWANLAWKKGAVKAILPWIRARWMEPAYRAAVADALRGLWIGGGLVYRKDKILVEEFLVEVWKEKDLPLALRAMVLPRLARAVTLPGRRVRALLLEARALWKKTRDRNLEEALLPAIEAFLKKGGDSAGPATKLLIKALRRLSSERKARAGGVKREADGT